MHDASRRSPTPGPSPRRPSLLFLRVMIMLLIAAPAGAAGQEPKVLDQLIIDGRNGRFEFQVELARTPAERGRGLMYRQHLADDRGMLFDYGTPRPISMWMRNTYIPLDMLFIEPGGRISKIVAETEPLSEDVINSESPVQAVLELRGGITGELGIETGDRVIHPSVSDGGG